MKLLNYLNLNQHPAHLQFFRDRTYDFNEIYHAHQGMEIIIVHEGTGSVVVQQQIYDIQPGTLIYFRPFQLHRIRIHDLPHRKYVRSMFVFEPGQLDSCLTAFPSTHALFRKLWKDPLCIQRLTGLDTEAAHSLLRTHQERIAQSKKEHLLEEQMFFLSALMHHLKHASEIAEPRHAVEQLAKGKSSFIPEKVMDWIEAHYMESFELDRLARDIYLSPNHVSAAFKKSVGSSITEYLTARRIRQACWLLKTSVMSIQEVGRAVGLGNFSYFCQMFKKHAGLTPYQFKTSPHT